MENEEILKTLEALGEKSNIVASTLRKMGIKGNRMSCRSCPIAEVLKMAGMADPFVSSRSAGAGKVLLGMVWLPEPVCEFIQDFDDKKYPDLIRMPLEITDAHV